MPDSILCVINNLRHGSALETSDFFTLYVWISPKSARMYKQRSKNSRAKSLEPEWLTLNPHFLNEAADKYFANFLLNPQILCTMKWL